MNVLAIDVGSSSVKMAVMRDGKLVGRPVRQEFPTRYSADRAEVDPLEVLKAIYAGASKLNSGHKVDLIALATMSPSWVAMDARGRAITPIITHQDRRSLDVAREIERRVGKARHLRLSGNRPIPGGISSTTCAWFLKHHRALMRRADLVGHVQTYLHRQLSGARVVDPSHASFMGLFSTLTLRGWSDELIDAIGISKTVLPEIRPANCLAGKLLPEPARRMGLPAGIPILVGMIDTGAAMLLAGAGVGCMVNVVGTTDVLALCTDHPRPHEQLLTRALGVGRKWTSVGTIAAAGSSLNWARHQFFADWSEKKFFSLCSQLARQRANSCGTVAFDPYLAGDRCSVEQRRAAFSGLTLSSTREQMLAAVIDALARASAERLDLLRWTGTRINKQVMISGGGGGALAEIMHRDWKGGWKFRVEEEATSRGLAVLAKTVV